MRKVPMLKLSQLHAHLLKATRCSSAWHQAGLQGFDKTLSMSQSMAGRLMIGRQTDLA